MISYKISDLVLIKDYLSLYNRCFHKFNKNLEYLKWQYSGNPMGNYIGIDVFDDNNLVGQIGGIPINFKFNNRHIKTIILLNTSIDYKYRGGIIFYNLAKKLEKTLIQKDYELLIGIGNEIATPAWTRSIQLKNLCQLKSLIGFYDFSKVQNHVKNYNIYTDWNDELIKWRCSNPINKTKLLNFKNHQLVSSKTNVPFINVYSPLLSTSAKNKSFRVERTDLSLKLFIGLSNEINKSLLFRPIPEYFKPSPLNFLYKFLNNDYHIDKNEIFFSFLDFDVF